MSGRWRTALVALGIMAAPHAHAHDYAELDLLSDEMRDALISLLEQAAAEGYLDGDAGEPSASTRTLSTRLRTVLSRATAEDIQWLETVDHPILEDPDFGRVPIGLVFRKFYALASDVAHFEEDDQVVHHQESELVEDIDRLRRLSDTVWGR